jgi:hypothetical protein
MAKLPFLEDDSTHGMSRTTFRKLRKAEKRELMIQWFHENYEDPSYSTPRDSGEFIYIWGGPYDARDEIYSKFGDIVPEVLVEDVIAEVERDGVTDWAPVRKDDDYDEGGTLSAPETLDDFSDERSETYGSPADLDARKRVSIALDELQNALDRPPPIGIGHNRPPEEIENEQLSELSLAASELKLEFNKPNPSISIVKRWGRSIWKALAAGGAAVGLGILSGIGRKVGEHLGDPVVHYMHIVCDQIFHWLQIAAQLLPYAN